MESAAGSGSIEQTREFTTARQTVAKLVLRWGLLLIGALAGSIVLATVLIFFNQCSGSECSREGRLTPDHALSFLQTLLTGILPVIASWVAAVIAFYFARENLDAAALNTRKLFQEFQPTSLTSIAVSSAMVSVDKLEVVRTSGDRSDTDKPMVEILARFQTKGLSRLVFLDGGDVGVGVLHDSVITQYLVATAQSNKSVSTVKVSELLEDTKIKATLAASVVWVAPDTSLAQVKQAMDEQSKASSIDCRDALVTSDGTKTAKVVGYISDIDIAKRGAYK